MSDNFTLSPLGVPPAVRWIVKGLKHEVTKKVIKAAIDSFQLYCNAEWLQSMVKY